MIKLFIDCSLMANLKAGETIPDGYILPTFKELSGNSWHSTSLKNWNIFPGIEYEIADGIIILMPFKKKRNIYIAHVKAN